MVVSLLKLGMPTIRSTGPICCRRSRASSGIAEKVFTRFLSKYNTEKQTTQYTKQNTMCHSIYIASSNGVKKGLQYRAMPFCTPAEHHHFHRPHDYRSYSVVYRANPIIKVCPEQTALHKLSLTRPLRTVNGSSANESIIAARWPRVYFSAQRHRISRYIL